MFKKWFVFFILVLSGLNFACAKPLPKPPAENLLLIEHNVWKGENEFKYWGLIEFDKVHEGQVLKCEFEADSIIYSVKLEKSSPDSFLYFTNIIKKNNKGQESFVFSHDENVRIVPPPVLRWHGPRNGLEIASAFTYYPTQHFFFLTLYNRKANLKSDVEYLKRTYGAKLTQIPCFISISTL